MEILTRTECLEIIEKSLKSKDFQLIDYRIENASENAIGFLGEYYKLLIEITTKNDDNTTENNNNRTKILKYFVKSLPIHNEQQRQQFLESGLFEKEVSLYELFEKFENCLNLNNEAHAQLSNYIKWRPLCFYKRSDVIVLEDLFDLNYNQLIIENDSACATTYTIFHMKAVLKCLSQMHALSLIYEMRNHINIGNEYAEILFETSISQLVDWYHVGIEAVRTVLLQHPNYQNVKYQNFIQNQFHHKIQPVLEMINQSTRFRNVLCHRDVWNQNIFFNVNNQMSMTVDIKNDESLLPLTDLNCILVDFQTCRYCPPAIDILFALYLNTRRPFREKYYNELIEWYHQQLQIQLKPFIENNSNECDTNNNTCTDRIITLQELYDSCEVLKLAAVLYNCIAGTILKLPKGYLTQLKQNSPQEYFRFGNVTRNEIVSQFLHQDLNFRQFMYEVTEELMDLIYE